MTDSFIIYLGCCLYVSESEYNLHPIIFYFLWDFVADESRLPEGSMAQVQVEEV